MAIVTGRHLLFWRFIMADFANSIMYRCRQNKMAALQYLEHCIRCCYNHNDVDGVNKFADVRDFIENNY